MASHRLHPDEGDPFGAVLFDACQRCEQYADDPNSLDDRTLVALCHRVIADDRTDAEHRALGIIGRARGLALRLGAVGA